MPGKESAPQRISKIISPLKECVHMLEQIILQYKNSQSNHNTTGM